MGVIRPSARLDGVYACVEIVPCRRTHWSRLKTSRKLHALICQLIEMGRSSLSSIHLHVEVGTVVRENENDVGLIGCFDMPIDDKQEGQINERRSHWFFMDEFSE